MHISQSLLDGLLLGGVYALMAAGLGLLWRATRVLDLSYGALVMLGSYLTYGLFRRLGLDPLLMLPVSAAVMAGLSWVLQRYVISRALQAPLVTCLLTLGIGLLMIQLVVTGFSSDTRQLSSHYSQSTITVGSASATVGQVLAFLFAIAGLGVLAVLLGRTRWGQVIRATALDEWVAAEMGVDTGRVQALVAAIAGGMAGVAGSLLAIAQPLSPGLGVYYTLVAFVGCVLVALDALAGALVGGFALALAQSLVQGSAGPGWQLTVAVALLLAVVGVRRAARMAHPVPIAVDRAG